MLSRVAPAAVVAAAAFMTTPQAEAAPATPVIRYAGLGSCPQADGGRHPCGPLKLWLSDGRVVALSGARRTVADDEYTVAAVIAVSQDGAQAAYFAGKDGVLTIWEAATGRAREVPSVTWPDDLRMNALTLSPGGRFLSMRGVNASEWEIDRVVDTTTGKVFTLPRGYQTWDFSPDGKRMMAGDNRTAVLYSTGTWSVRLRRSVYMRGDLGPDGVTVAAPKWTKTGNSVKNVVLTRNLATAKKGSIPIRLHAGETALTARWDKAGHLDVLTRSDRQVGGDLRRTHTWYRVNRATHQLRRLDSFVIPSSVGGYVLAD
ncbi:hypothetical protein [Microbispora catharanthi]|uniref:WD40 repeat domain-containing protein n=1 Tax=Microbispora catharanthi TaxID=1712871 RepID=A0A5N6C4B4_9ACTN|nr:hypothetical protein [Microbispora catharanthi]KAB8187645.1 hypothetical protein FH610_000230 [Microbispora catharanthi]